MACFLAYPRGHPFPVENLPYGVFSPAAGGARRIGVAIADSILDLAALARSETLLAGSGVPGSVLEASSLNALLALEPEAWSALRRHLQALLRPGSPLDRAPDRAAYLVDQSAVQMHLPIVVGDYTDFYASLEHATNCGTLIRGKDKALQPNWRHLPVAYHGRAS